MRAREKEVWTIRQYIMHASPCGAGFIFLGGSFKGKQEYCRDKGGVVLAESTITLLSPGRLVHLTPDACSPKPLGISIFQVVRAPEKGF